MKGLAFQLVLEADHLPAWFPRAPDEAPPDVSISISVSDLDTPSASGEGAVPGDRDSRQLHYPGLASVAIEGGTSVRIILHRGVDPHVAELLITGPVLGVLLHQRGALVQHASAIRHRDGAVIFTGASTWGKSTIASLLYRHGYPIVADDVVPLSWVSAGVTTVPGFPAIKLWPDAARAIGEDPEGLPPVGVSAEKRLLGADRGFRTAALPVSRIYILTPGERPSIQPISPRDAFIELVRHSYLARYLGSASEQSRRFRHVERVVRSVVIKRLTHGTVDELRRVPDLILSDISPVS